MQQIGIVGAGAWGTALAIVAAQAGHEVKLWDRDDRLVAELRRTHENSRHLQGIGLPDTVEATSETQSLLNADTVLLVVPAQALRQACAPLAAARNPLVICAKGIERGTGMFMSEVVREICPHASIAALSGPSFAREVAKGLPTAVTIAASKIERGRELARLLATPSFRPYPSDDLLGVEIGGALKNVIAVAAGAVMGGELGENARAAVITRGLAEIARLSAAMGGRRETLMGLSGLGDLMLTATSLTSRNTRFGYELAHGRLPEDLMRPDAALAEGAWTAEAACERAHRLGVELPISEAVCRVVNGEIGIDAAVEGLLARPLRPIESA